MSRPVCLFVLLALVQGAAHLSLAESTAAPGDREPVFFVAPDGNDQWSGGRPEANADRTDRPFATLPRLLQVARGRRHQPGETPAGPITASVRGGVYFLTQPLVLKTEDSGTTLAAYGKEEPVLSGGRRIRPLPREPVKDGQSATITLVPYGCTKFRVSMFPVAAQQSEK